MELFKVSCVTCKASLSVRNESLIGQIVACPRCGSMVEVQPPTVSEPAISEAAPVTPAPPIAELVNESVAEPAQPETLSVASTAAATYKLIAWSLAGILIGGAAIGWVLFGSDESEAEVATAAPAELTEADIVEPPTVSSRIESEPQERDETPNEAQPKIEPQDELTTTDSPVTLQETTLTSEPENLAPAVEEPEQQPTPEPKPEEPPRLARRFNPLDFDPASLSLDSLDQIPEQEPADNSTPPAVEPTDQPEETPDAVPSTTPVVRRGPAGKQEGSSRDATEQLAFVFPNIEIKQMPFVDCLRLFSRLSGVPISVTPEQLLMAGITPRTKVSLSASEVSLGDMLERILKPLRLEHTTSGSHAVILRHEAGKRREISYPVDDLVSTSTNAEQIAAWIEQLVTPSSWQSAGGQGTLNVESNSLKIAQTQQVQYQVLIFLERLRLSRNLPPQSRYPVKKLAGTPPNAQLSEQLTAKTTFTFSQFTALDDIFVHWQTELGIPLLIDWPALETLELGPESTISCAITNQPWSTALERVLEPLGLGWRTAPGGAIEITSAEKVQTELQLELYPLQSNSGIDPQQLIAQLRKLAQQEATNSPVVILYDPIGNVLLSLQPASTQRLFFKKLQQQQQLLLANSEK